MKKNIILTTLLIFLLSPWLYAQGVDVDLLFENDPEAKAFYENFSSKMLNVIPEWDDSIVYNEERTLPLDLKLKIYNSQLGQENLSCIIFFHGGGWTSGNADQFKRHAYYFSTQGYKTISVEYRLNAIPTDLTLCNAIKDAKSAVRYVRKNAQELGIDPNKIIVSGMSAGGHLAASTAFITERCAEADGHGSTSYLPNALMLLNPAVNFSEDGCSVCHEIFGGDGWMELSPFHKLDDKCSTIPSVVLSGDSDNTTPFENMTAWDVTYRDKGGFSQLYRFKNRNHGFGNYGRSEEHTDFIYSLYIMESFLLETGYSSTLATANIKKTIRNRNFFKSSLR